MSRDEGREQSRQLALDLDERVGVERETCALVRELEALARQGLKRRVLVARSKGEGREVLGALARRGCSWVGFEVTTPLLLAEKILDRAGVAGADRRIDEFDEQRLLEQALDEVMAREEAGVLRELSEKVGFRKAVRSAVKEVRIAGISGRGWATRSQASERLRLVMAVLERYEALLDEAGRTDDAWALRRAAKIVEDAASDPNGPRHQHATYLLPGHADEGLRGRFLRALRRGGAVLLRTDPVNGLELPPRRRALWEAAMEEAPGSRLHDIGSFGGRPAEHARVYRAASRYDELRGVLRRVLAHGARWDQVEIIASDPMTYGSALHALAEPLGIPVTFAAGLPVQRTRPGRVVAAYFRWIDEQLFPEPVIRSLLEAGDLRSRKKELKVLPRRLAEALRRLRIGYRRDRYEPAIRQAQADVERMQPYRYESAERLEDRKKWRVRELAALEDIIGTVLDATPPTDGSPVSPAQIASGARSLLDRTARGTAADMAAREELLRRLGRIEEELNRPTDFGSAAAIVQGLLSVPVAPPVSGDEAGAGFHGRADFSDRSFSAEGQAPWTSAHGHLHLSSLEHGGLSGRPYTFLVGMDSGSFPGPAHEDPLLSDGDRQHLANAAGLEIPLTFRLAESKARERRFDFAELFARLRGQVWISYTSWEPAQARELAPAAEVLQAFRLAQGKSALSFNDLAEHIQVPESRLPGAPDRLLDREDAWIHAIKQEDGQLMWALEAVGRAYPALGDGMAAAKALSAPAPSVHTGMLGTRPVAFPFQDLSDLRLSAGALEDLGACPRRFLFRAVLRAYPPDDPEFDPHRWLNAMQRGKLLHNVFERTLQKAKDQGIAPGAAAFLALARDQVEREAKRISVEAPCPSEAVRDWELNALRADAAVFVEMIRDRDPAWLEVEYEFGDPDPMKIDFGGRAVQLRGRIDRVDELAESSAEPTRQMLRIVDYKTGRLHQRWEEKFGVYDGGRRLQHVVYAAVAEACLKRPVERMEYHFSTRRGENEVVSYSAEQIEGGSELVAAMLAGAESGWFPATDDKGDCRFCDYKPACGVREYDDEPCKPVAWTAAQMPEEPCEDDGLEAFRKVRNWEHSRRSALIPEKGAPG